jgi:hypothetical protein
MRNLSFLLDYGEPILNAGGSGVSVLFCIVDTVHF